MKDFMRKITSTLLVLISFYANGQTNVTWTDLTGVEVQNDNALVKTAGWGTTNGGAASVETLAAGASGWAEFTAYATGYERYFGLTQSNIDAGNVMDYTIKLNNNNNVVIQENGSPKAGFGTFVDGDVLRIERTGSTVEYKWNGDTFYTSQTASSTSLVVDACFYHSGGAINNAVLSFGTAAVVTVPDAPENLQGTATISGIELNWTDTSSNENGFRLERKTGTGAYELLATINANIITYKDTDVLPETTYSYRLTSFNDAEGSGYSNIVTLTTPATPPPTGSAVTWTDLVGVAVQADNSLVKTAGWGTDNAGAASSEVLAAGVDGWVEFTVYATNHERYFGLTQSNTNAGSVMDYAIKLSSTNTIVVQENGTSKGGFGELSDGDVLRIERTGTSIEYKKNGIVFYPSQVVSTSPLLVDVCFYHKGGEIKNVDISFGRFSNTGPAPQKLQATVTDFDKIQLEWESTKDVAYEIERSVTSGTGYSLIATTTPGTSTYKDHSLEANTLYYYRIRGVYKGDQSVYSTEVFGTTKTPQTTDLTQDHNPVYNGNISAIKWKTHGDAEEKLYTYKYDPMNRITKAQYAQRNTATHTWTSAKGGYSVNNINYDLNGNIQSLNRQSMEEDLRTIDALTYTYNGKGNQLTAVSDAAGWDGFTDRNTTGDDYEYDANGNMTKDRNKEIEAIEYNNLNLPVKVLKTDGKYIKYIYDATGVKLAQEVYDAGDSLVKRTDYMGEFIYENGELQLIQHEEGRIVKGEGNSFDYQYHLKDHLGNTRLTFTTKPKTI
ncbi:RHS repeat domain-containing protein, partial [Fulvivirga kasyanovii]